MKNAKFLSTDKYRPLINVEALASVASIASGLSIPRKQQRLK